MKIVAFAGSNSSQSINKKLVKHALSYLELNNEIYLLDLNEFEMPIFSIDRELFGYPPQVYLFRQQFENCDCIVVSLAENNKTYSAALKNILDWCSRIDINIFKNKPMFLMSTSTGKHAGEQVMAAAKFFFPKAGATIIETFSLPSFENNFDESVGITNPELKAEFEKKIQGFKDYLSKPII